MKYSYLITLLSTVISVYAAHPKSTAIQPIKSTAFSICNPFSWCGAKPAKNSSKNNSMSATAASMTATTAAQAHPTIYPEDFLDDVPAHNDAKEEVKGSLPPLHLSATGQKIMNMIAQAQQENPTPSAADAEELIYATQALGDQLKQSPSGLEVKQSHA